jgi:hypothetical protein
LQAAGAALRDDQCDLIPDVGWDLADAALVARSLAAVTAYLPEVVATLKTTIDHTGTPVEVEGYLEAMRTAQDLVAHAQRLAHNLDPHYGPHGRHPHRRP